MQESMNVVNECIPKQEPVFVLVRLHCGQFNLSVYLHNCLPYCNICFAGVQGHCHKSHNYPWQVCIWNHQKIALNLTIPSSIIWHSQFIVCIKNSQYIYIFHCLKNIPWETKDTNTWLTSCWWLTVSEWSRTPHYNEKTSVLTLPTTSHNGQVVLDDNFIFQFFSNGATEAYQIGQFQCEYTWICLYFWLIFDQNNQNEEFCMTNNKLSMQISITSHSEKTKYTT